MAAASASRLPVYFFSHGAPDMILRKGFKHYTYIKTVGERETSNGNAPKCIISISAHWETRSQVLVTSAPKNDQIYDFGGFQREMYEFKWTPPGHPAVASRIVELLNSAGISAQADSKRGLDHGTWCPLSVAFPSATIPVVQVSLLSTLDAAEHYAIGKALAPLRSEGCLIIGSGGITHNLREIEWGAVDSESERSSSPPFQRFNDFIHTNIMSSDVDKLLQYKTLQPDWQRVHPRVEHLIPLFVSLGAAEGDAPTRDYQMFFAGTFSLDCYRWA